MATRYWVGRAASVAQVTKIVYSVVAASNTYSVTINGKTVSFTTTTAVLADLVDGLVAAWSASAEPEHQEMIAAQRLDPTLSGLELTAVTAGVPVTVTAAATTGIATVTQPTAASGPNFWNLAANWDGGTLPAAADDLVVKDTAVSILYGLTDTTNYTSLSIDASFVGQVGLPSTNVNGYPEYRTQSLTLGSGSAIAVNIGYGLGTFPSLVKLNLNASNATVTQFGGVSSNAGNVFQTEIITAAASSTYRVYGGSMLIDSLTSATITSLDLIKRDSSQAPPYVKATNAITVTTVTSYGGTGLFEGPVTTLVARETSTITSAKAAASATVRVGSGSLLNWESSGGITTKLHVEAGGTVDFGRVGTTKTVAACDCYANGTILDPIDKVTFTTGIVLVACRLANVTLDVGLGNTINA